MINFLIIIENAVYTLGLITLQDQKIKSNNIFFLCVGRLINILVLFLLQHLSWIERYSTMKIGRFFFVWVCDIMPTWSMVQKSSRLQVNQKTGDYGNSEINFSSYQSGLTECRYFNMNFEYIYP